MNVVIVYGFHRLTLPELLTYEFGHILAILNTLIPLVAYYTMNLGLFPGNILWVTLL